MKRMAIVAAWCSGCATAATTGSKGSDPSVCESNVIAIVPSSHWNYDDAVVVLKAEQWITDASNVVQASNKPRVRNPAVMGRTMIMSTPGTKPDLSSEARMLVEMDVNGKIVRSHIARSSGNIDLDEFTRRLIESSEYEPALFNGCRVPAMMMIPVSLRGPGRR